MYMHNTHTVVSRLSELEFSGLLQFSGQFLLLIFFAKMVKSYHMNDSI